MIVSLYGDFVVKPGKEADDARLGAEMEAILRAVPGFISYKEYTADDGEVVGIIRMETREALDAWVRTMLEHAATRSIASEAIYQRFWVQSAETYREYTWEDGVRTDGDLTAFFRRQETGP